MPEKDIFIFLCPEEHRCHAKQIIVHMLTQFEHSDLNVKKCPENG